MTGPFHVTRRDGAEYVSIHSKCESICTIESNREEMGEALAHALVGVLNSAPADQPLAVTLQRMAEGKLP